MSFEVLKSQSVIDYLFPICIRLIQKIINIPFATTWMDLEDIMLSEISQRKILRSFHMWNLSKQTNEQNKTYRYREQIGSCQRGVGLEGGLGEDGQEMYTSSYKINK